MTKNSHFHKVAALALAVALAAPLSAAAETRRLSQTDVEQIASQVLSAITTSRRVQTTPAPQTSRAPRDDDRQSAPRRSSPAQSQTGSVSREAVLNEMNQERESRGLGPLRLDSRLNAAAADRMNDMFEKGYFDHVSPDGTQPFVWVKYRHYTYATVGENLAEGYRSAGGVVNGWMNSPGHRANLLGRSFEDAGIAIVRGSPSGRTNGYTVVALYAREASRRATSVMARR